MKSTHDCLIGITLIVFAFLAVSLYDYVREKVHFRASGQVGTPSGPRSLKQWLKDKLHLPREKYAQRAPQDKSGDTPPGV